MVDLRIAMDDQNKQNAQELQAEYNKRRANELELLEAAHRREMEAQEAAGERRMQQALEAQRQVHDGAMAARNAEWERSLRDQEVHAAQKEADIVAALEQVSPLRHLP